MSNPRTGDSGCRLYLVTPATFEPATFARHLAAALDAGDVACVQLRLKDVGDDAVRRACDALRPIVQARDVAFVLNDWPRLAAETGCDGVHVGQTDTSCAEARRILGDAAIVGVSCNDSRHLAIEAAEAGADYVAFGSVYATATKQTPHHAGLELFAWWNELMEVPSVAIGGLTPENCGPVVAAGADFLAVVSAVWDHPDGPAAAVRRFNQAIAAAQAG